MATILDGAIDRQRRADIAANAVALGECSQKAFVVQVKRGPAIRLTFEAMGRDACTVAAQHEDLCGDGEYVKVQPRQAVFTEDDLLAADLERATGKAAKAHARNDRDALDLQAQHLRCVGAL